MVLTFARTTTARLSNYGSNFQFNFERLNIKFSNFLIFPTTLSNYMQP